MNQALPAEKAEIGYSSEYLKPLFLAEPAVYDHQSFPISP